MISVQKLAENNVIWKECKTWGRGMGDFKNSLEVYINNKILS